MGGFVDFENNFQSVRRIESMTSKKNAKNSTPSYAIIDAQSVKTVGPNEERGYDGGKKVKGRKRHIVVDTLGHLIHIIVHAANISDTKTGCPVLAQAKEKCATIHAFSGDAGYRGTAVQFVENTLGSTKVRLCKERTTI